jgi:hypothetical protein
MRKMALILALALAGCSSSAPARDGKAGDGRTAGDGVRPGTDGRKTGTGKVGDPCTRDEDCVDPPDAQCFTTIGGGLAPTITFPGGYCSKACETDGGTPDCGSVGGCSTISMGGGRSSMTLTMCTRGCTRPDECRVSESYSCKIIFLGLGFCGI